ncbi:MAG: hypothetical protein KF861_24100, partial [Planctomycetaceae bacterium]|nr:hypothetical protein [Planctomycetaceae bacterium]
TYDPEHGYVPLGLAPSPFGGYGYGGYGAAATPGMSAGAAMAGFGQAAQGVGQLHVSNAQASEIHQQAVSQYLQNVGQAQDTVLKYAAQKDQATQARNDAEKEHEKAQIALYNKTLEQMGAAHRLTAEQFHVDSGVLHWPFVLRGPQYDALRNKIDKLYDARTPDDSGEDSSGYDAIQQACKDMQKIVDKEVQAGMPVNDFVTAKHFISSVAYEAQFKVKPSK